MKNIIGDLSSTKVFNIKIIVSLLMLLLALGGLFQQSKSLDDLVEYTYDTQSEVLSTQYRIEQLGQLLNYYFYIQDQKKRSEMEVQLRRLKAEIDISILRLSKNEKIFYLMEPLKSEWEDEVKTFIEVSLELDRDDVDLQLFNDYIENFQRRSSKIVDIINISKEKDALRSMSALVFFIVIIIFIIGIYSNSYFRHILDFQKVKRFLDELRLKKVGIEFDGDIHDQQLGEIIKKVYEIQDHCSFEREKRKDYLSVMNDVIFTCRQNFEIIEVTDKVSRLLGFGYHDLLGKQFNDLFESHNYFSQLEWKFYENSKLLYRYKTKCVHQKGHNVPIYLTMTSYFDKIEKEGRILICISDASDSEELIEMSNKSKILFHNSKMAALGEMSGSIAHEINNPLMIIKGSLVRITKVLQRENHLSEKVDAIIDRLNRMADRIASIVVVMQSFGESKDNQVKEFISVREVVIETLNLCSQKLKIEGIDIDVNFDTHDMKVRAYKSDITQAIMSIIQNAYEAILLEGIEEGRVSIKSEFTKGRFFLTIRNNGPSIAKVNQKKVFDPFFSTRESNVGMGLSIAHTLCQRNEVDLKLDSCNPVTFRLEFLGAIKNT